MQVDLIGFRGSPGPYILGQRLLRGRRASDIRHSNGNVGVRQRGVVLPLRTAPCLLKPAPTTAPGGKPHQTTRKEDGKSSRYCSNKRRLQKLDEAVTEVA